MGHDTKISLGYICIFVVMLVITHSLFLSICGTLLIGVLLLFWSSDDKTLGEGTHYHYHEGSPRYDPLNRCLRSSFNRREQEGYEREWSNESRLGHRRSERQSMNRKPRSSRNQKRAGYHQALSPYYEKEDERGWSRPRHFSDLL